MSDAEATKGAKQPNTVLLALTLLVGGVAGAGAGAIILDAAWLLLPVAVATAISSALVAIRCRTFRPQEPSLTERLIAASHASVQDGLTVALLSLVVYAVFYGSTWVIHWFGWVDLSPAQWAFWAAATAMVAMSLIGENKQDVADTLFPPTREYELPYRQAAREGRYLWWAGISVAVAVVAACILLWGYGSAVANVVWTLTILIGGGAAVPEEAAIYEQSDDYDEIVQRIATALDETAYTALINPITEDDAVDESMQEADVFAQSSDGPSLLVDIRLGGGSLGWKEATPIVTAAVILQRWLDDESRVEPVLMLVDATADEGLVSFAGDAALHLLEYDSQSAVVKAHVAPTALAATVEKALAGFSRRTESRRAGANHG